MPKGFRFGSSATTERGPPFLRYWGHVLCLPVDLSAFFVAEVVFQTQVGHVRKNHGQGLQAARCRRVAQIWIPAGVYPDESRDGND